MFSGLIEVWEFSFHRSTCPPELPSYKQNLHIPQDEIFLPCQEPHGLLLNLPVLGHALGTKLLALVYFCLNAKQFFLRHWIMMDCREDRGELLSQPRHSVQSASPRARVKESLRMSCHPLVVDCVSGTIWEASRRPRQPDPPDAHLPALENASHDPTYHIETGRPACHA